MTTQTTSDEEKQYRIERLEFVLGTLIVWLMRDLGEESVQRLMSALTSDEGLQNLRGAVRGK